MSAPVTLSSSGTPATTGATGTSSAVPLPPLGSPLFSNLLLLGASGFNMTPAPEQSQQKGHDVLATDTIQKAASLSRNNFGLQQALLISRDELESLSQEDLKSLLANFHNTSDELSPKILLALTPGVPAQEAFNAIKAKFSELGIDTSEFMPVAIATPATATDIAGPADATTLSIESSEAEQSINFLLITTGFTPSEMGAVKDALKSSAGNSSDELSGNGTDASVMQIADNSDDVNISAAMVMMIFVLPATKTIEPPTVQDATFDLSALSAFTHPSADSMEEPDWARKLSDKLSTMSLGNDVSPFDENASPFDDEMNAILSPATPKATEAGFQGSIATNGSTAKDVDTSSKAVTGEISSQALLSLNHEGLGSSASLHHLNGDGAFMSNGNMLAAQNMSPLINPIFTSGTATGTHPGIHAVAVLIEKAASGSEKAKQELSVQLDPPELGRMQVQLSMEKDGQMKVHLLAEKEETLSLFQRDAHALKSALSNAGIQIDNSSLTFDLASGDQSFNQLMGGSQQDGHSRNNESGAITGTSGGATHIGEATTTETKMDFVTNSITGTVHYSFWA